MIAAIVYTPLAIALTVLFLYSTRGALRGYGNGRLIPFSLLVGASLFGSLALMFLADMPWLAVAVAAVVAVPILTPVALIIASGIISWVSGSPMRWN